MTKISFTRAFRTSLKIYFLCGETSLAEAFKDAFSVRAAINQAIDAGVPDEMIIAALRGAED